MPLSPDRSSTARADPALWPGFLAAAVLAAVLRGVHLTSGLPALPASDEPLLVSRSLLLLDGSLPTEYDWPTGAMVVLAGALRTARVGWSSVAHDLGAQLVLARIVFAVVGVALVVATGWLGAAMTGDRHRRAVGWGSAVLVAVAYTAVRAGRVVHPEELQSLAVVGALACSLRLDRTGLRRWLLAAAALAGVAAAAKYLGGLVLAVPVAVVALDRTRSRRARAGAVALAGVVAAAAFALLVPAAVLHTSAVLDGIVDQVAHQDQGHLGYDASSPSLGFHLTRSLVGSWGLVATALALVGLITGLARGERAERLVGGYVLLAAAVLGVSNLRFPHYVLLYLPALAPFVVIGALRLARWVRVPPVAMAGLLAVSLVPTLIDDAKLVRAAGATSTRVHAAAVLDRLEGPITTELYTDVVSSRANVGSLGEHPEVVDCRCYVVISSYMEERYRAEPQRYASQVAVYDAVRAAGDVVAVIKPARPLSYRWDLLPRWGADRIPLTGPVGDVGPTITIVDLRPLTTG